MSNRDLRRALDALYWEATYRKRATGKDTGQAFLEDLQALDEDFAQALRESGIRGGKLLEIGTGAGWQAIQFAQRGFEVTATDVSETGVAEAARNCAACQANVRLLVDDILKSSLDEKFDVIVDRGCYTTLAARFLSDYVAQVSKLIQSNGLFLLKLDRKSESRLSHVLSLFDCLKQVHGAYKGPAPLNVVYKTTFCVLCPMAAPT